MPEQNKEGQSLPNTTKMGRRDFLIKSTVAGAALIGMPAIGSRGALASTRSKSAEKPNILTIIVDELRYPQWFPQRDELDRLLPSMARLRRSGVNFTGHYAAAAACSPSRATLMTGLYAHQNGIFNNQNKKTPSLDPGFTTWGGALREFGYSTNWYGKWHLSTGDTLEPYGFDGGTYPSPNGGAQNGTRKDGHTVDQFLDWFDGESSKSPWATTVSLLNPHDVMFYPNGTADFLQQNPPAGILRSLPANFETAEQLKASKPRMQQAHQAASDARYGVMPYSGDGWEQSWLGYANAYIQYQQLADQQIGHVLDALDKQPAVRDNTIILFYSDHGEYGGSHGLRGKAGAVYEESIHVPLTITDPTGRWGRRADIPRTQLTSMVDIFGLLLTLGSGGNDWRSRPQYAHLAGRLDLAAILQNPRAPGRPYVLHTCDSPPSAYPVPTRVIGYRTANAKIGTYNYWKPDSLDIQPGDQDLELYDFSTDAGRKELNNEADTKPRLFQPLHDALIHDAIPNELQQKLPPQIQQTHERALDTYFTYLKTAATSKKDVNE